MVECRSELAMVIICHFVRIAVILALTSVHRVWWIRIKKRLLTIQLGDQFQRGSSLDYNSLQSFAEGANLIRIFRPILCGSSSAIPPNYRSESSRGVFIFKLGTDASPHPDFAVYGIRSETRIALQDRASSLFDRIPRGNVYLIEILAGEWSQSDQSLQLQSFPRIAEHPEYVDAFAIQVIVEFALASGFLHQYGRSAAEWFDVTIMGWEVRDHPWGEAPLSAEIAHNWTSRRGNPGNVHAVPSSRPCASAPRYFSRTPSQSRSRHFLTPILNRSYLSPRSSAFRFNCASYPATYGVPASI